MTSNATERTGAGHRPEDAKAYEAVHNRLFLLQLILTAAILGAYFFSGASVNLAAGLRGFLGARWWAVNACYVAITVFGFAVMLFPVSLYIGHTIERQYGLSNQNFEQWLVDYLKSLALEMLLAVVFFSVVYAFLRWMPNAWWIAAAMAYSLLIVVLSAVAPVWILPLFHRFEPLPDSDLTQAVRRFVEREGLRVLGVYTWGLKAKTEAANAALAG